MVKRSRLRKKSGGRKEVSRLKKAHKVTIKKDVEVEITRKDWNEFERIRFSGVTNMYDASRVEGLSGGQLTKDKQHGIRKNYDELEKVYGKPSHKKTSDDSDVITMGELEKKWKKAFEDPEYSEYEDFNEFVQSYRDSGWTVKED